MLYHPASQINQIIDLRRADEEDLLASLIHFAVGLTENDVTSTFQHGLGCEARGCDVIVTTDIPGLMCHATSGMLRLQTTLD